MTWRHDERFPRKHTRTHALYPSNIKSKYNTIFIMPIDFDIRTSCRCITFTFKTQALLDSDVQYALWLPGHSYTVAKVFWMVQCVAKALLGCCGCSPVISTQHPSHLSSNVTLGCDIISQRRAEGDRYMQQWRTELTVQQTWPACKSQRPAGGKQRSSRAGRRERDSCAVSILTNTHIHTRVPKTAWTHLRMSQKWLGCDGWY